MSQRPHVEDTQRKAWDIVLLGESGLLGGAILNSCRADANARTSAAVPNTRLLLRQLLDGNLEGVNALCHQRKRPQVWIFAAGLIDPSISEIDLMRINVEAPARLYAALGRAEAEGAEVRFVTFGSILEEREEYAAANVYIRSKARLKNLWHEQALAGGVVWTHYQLHTLYGGRRPPPFMFLGQMEAALRRRVPFHMSSGGQLREYHHASDMAVNLLHHLGTAAPVSDKITLNSGCPMRLKDLAEAVFHHFGRPELLNVGARALQPGEVFEACFARSEYVVAFRDAVRGIIAWLEELGIVAAP